MVKILLIALKEILLALVAKVAFKAVAERFITRLVIWGLTKLADKTSNDLVHETVADIITQLRGKRLKVADEL